MVGFLQTFFQTLAITFSSMAVFTGTPLYGPSLRYAGPASLIWGWVVVTFFTWFVGIAMAEICSSFPVYILISYIYIYVHFSQSAFASIYTEELDLHIVHHCL